MNFQVHVVPFVKFQLLGQTSDWLKSTNTLACGIAFTDCKMNHQYSPKAEVNWFMIISGMLVRVKLPPFFPFLSKLSSTLKLMQFLNGLSYSDELGGKLKVFPFIFHSTFHLECCRHKKIIIFASTHGSEIIHPIWQFFPCFRQTTILLQTNAISK